MRKFTATCVDAAYVYSLNVSFNLQRYLWKILLSIYTYSELVIYNNGSIYFIISKESDDYNESLLSWTWID